jgi:hypothetical protein
MKKSPIPAVVEALYLSSPFSKLLNGPLVFSCPLSQGGPALIMDRREAYDRLIQLLQATRAQGAQV